jgi:hypothetical protein
MKHESDRWRTDYERDGYVLVEDSIASFSRACARASKPSRAIPIRCPSTLMPRSKDPARRRQVEMTFRNLKEG